MTDAALRPISRYPVPALDAMPEDIRARILKVQEKSGFERHRLARPLEVVGTRFVSGHGKLEVVPACSSL